MKKFYNVMFPLFFLAFFPITWLYILPANFVIDSLVVFLGMKHLKLDNKKEVYKKSILKVWLIGFLSDMLGCLVLLPSIFIKNDSFKEAMIWNLYKSPISVLLYCLAIFLAGLAIYYLNKKISFKKTELNIPQIHKLSLYLAVFTAPYVLLIPTCLLYHSAF